MRIFKYLQLLSLLCLINSNSYSSPIAESTTLKILNFNTWFIPIKRKYAKQRRKMIGEFLLNQQYDMVFLQELFTYRVAKKLRKYLPRNYVARYPKTSRFRFNAGLFQLFKEMKILKTDFKHFGKLCGSGECLAKKGVYFLRVKTKEGIIIDVYNTHLEAHDRDFPIRKKQLILLKNFVDKNSGKGRYPVILAGDYNIHDKNPEQYNYLMDLLHEYKDVLKEATRNDPNKYPYTWDSRINQQAHYNPDKDSFESARLDYIFIKSGTESCVSLKSSQVVLNEKKVIKRFLGRRTREIYPSDHFGVEAEIKIYPCPAVIND
ncbi:hypothetical protein N9N67_08110 [Bacteriovoracaceae bacterium]|nr:hypothetical protein [Bacteriovoracaceae bacterium]